MKEVWEKREKSRGENKVGEERHGLRLKRGEEQRGGIGGGGRGRAYGLWSVAVACAPHKLSRHVM